MGIMVSVFSQSLNVNDICRISVGEFFSLKEKPADDLYTHTHKQICWQVLNQTRRDKKEKMLIFDYMVYLIKSHILQALLLHLHFFWKIFFHTFWNFASKVSAYWIYFLFWYLFSKKKSRWCFKYYFFFFYFPGKSLKTKQLQVNNYGKEWEIRM